MMAGMPASTHDGDGLRDARIRDWDGTPAHARELQATLAGELDPRDGFPATLSLVAGLAARTLADGRVRAAAVLLDAATLAVLGRHVAEVARPCADGPAPLSFQFVPALLAALASLPGPPDLVFVEGHGTAHPEGLGVAAHLGVAAACPAIGVAGELLFGSGPRPHETRGAYTALRDASRRQIGWLLRSLPGSSPLVVSPAHRVALASTADLVMRFTADHRLPEPLRLARVLVEARGQPPGPAGRHGRTVDASPES